MSKLRFLTLAGLATTLLTMGCQQANTNAGGAPSPVSSPAAVATPGQAAPHLIPGQIKPGVGIPGVSLGQSRAEIVKSLGEPEAMDSNEFVPGQAYGLYYSKGIELVFSNDVLESIVLHAPPEKDWPVAYGGATDQGFGVGTPATDILEALGAPEPGTPRALRYPKLGIWFRLDADHTSADPVPRVESVQIMKPET
jgi:hypothetical protein